MNLSAPSSALCEECSLFDWDALQADGYVLKPTWAALIESAKKGCRLCKLIEYEAHSMSDSEYDDEGQGEDQIVCTRNFAIAKGSVRPGEGRRRHVLWLEMLAEKVNEKLTEDGVDDPIQTVQHFKTPLPRESQSDESFKFISDWLKICQSGHSTCSGLPQGQQEIPPRLIKVAPLNVDGDVRLGRPGFREDNHYLALSHCWGKTPTLKTTKTTLLSHHEHIAWNALPATFQDAITITRRLGFNYLWIDSLCIVQDDPTDWQAHIGSMGDIYSNATLCIIAEMTASSDAGIFRPANRVRQENHIVVPWISRILKLKGELCTRYPMRSDKHEWGGPLSRRAWTLQESTMASRIVRYGKEQLYVRCENSDFDEAFPSRVPPPGDFDFGRDHQGIFKPFRTAPYPMNITTDGPWTVEGLLDHEERATGLRLTSWYRMIDDYAVRGLTVETDRFPAIAGIATTVQNILGFHYFAGLWLEDLHWGLLWRARGRASKPSTYVAPSRRGLSWRARIRASKPSIPFKSSLTLLWRARGRAWRLSTYLAPSWSWASIVMIPKEIKNEFDPAERRDFPIYERDSQARGTRSMEARVLGIDVKNAFGTNRFLQVSSGVLKMESHSIGLYDYVESDQDFVLYFDFRAATDERYARRTLLDFDFKSDKENPPFELGLGVKLFLIAQWEVHFTPSLNRGGIVSGTSTLGEKDSNWMGKTLYALILEPTEMAGHLKRIGVAEIPEERFKIEDWNIETVTII